MVTPPKNKFKYIYLRILSKIFTEYKKLGNYRKSDHDYWASLKDKYKGKRGFVIGNGPSLKVDDLDALHNEVTIASNKIYMIFSETAWRPTIYTVADRILWPKINSEIENHFPIIHIPDYLDRGGLKSIRYWKSPLTFFKKKCSIDLTEGAYGGHTVTYENLQIAMHLGLNPIYMIGCDHNYKGEKNVTAGIPIRQSDEQTHFVKNYRKPGEVVLPAAIHEMEKAYTRARKAAEMNNIRIFNATRGGQLEVFERIDFDKIVIS